MKGKKYLSHCMSDSSFILASHLIGILVGYRILGRTYFQIEGLLLCLGIWKQGGFLLGT